MSQRWNSHPFGNCQHTVCDTVKCPDIHTASTVAGKKKKKMQIIKNYHDNSSQQITDNSVLVRNM